MINEKFTKEFNSLVYETEDDKKLYSGRGNEITERFKLALLREHGVEDNPKAMDVWIMAWDQGHSGGYEDVESYFEQLVGLIEEQNKSSKANPEPKQNDKKTFDSEEPNYFENLRRLKKDLFEKSDYDTRFIESLGVVLK